MGASIFDFETQHMLAILPLLYPGVSLAMEKRVKFIVKSTTPSYRRAVTGLSFPNSASR